MTQSMWCVGRFPGSSSGSRRGGVEKEVQTSVVDGFGGEGDGRAFIESKLGVALGYSWAARVCVTQLPSAVGLLGYVVVCLRLGCE